MLFRLVRPVRRKGSRVPYFVQRIPADLKPHVGGIALAIPLGNGFHNVKLRAGANDIRFSLGTTDSTEAKVRQAAAAGYLETVWQALRSNAPVSLTHRSCRMKVSIHAISRDWAVANFATAVGGGKALQILTLSPSGKRRHE